MVNISYWQDRAVRSVTRPATENGEPSTGTCDAEGERHGQDRVLFQLRLLVLRPRACAVEHVDGEADLAGVCEPAGGTGRMQRVPQRGICRNYRPRPATPEGEVKQIPVGGGAYAYVDAADFDWLNQWTWHLRNGYAVRCEKGKVIFLHREIMQPPEGKVVDHKNHNKLDDTRVNLRTCTRGENARNHAKMGNTSSRFIGVYYCKDRDKWRAEIQFEGKPTFLGYFTREIEAARAHDRAAVAYFGEFAPLNFPQEWPPQRRAQVYAQAQEQRRRISARRRPAGRKDRRRTAGRKPRSRRPKESRDQGNRKKQEQESRQERERTQCGLRPQPKPILARRRQERQEEMGYATKSHKKQILTHLRLAHKKLGFLLNFGVAVMKEGITRTVNGLEEGR